ncbi:MAG: ABC transporter substrate-binding protein [Acetobacteraceae bacterium]|nr:ABC transporter substrate-binding protein [Acetobacteraceae bacterium]
MKRPGLERGLADPTALISRRSVAMGLTSILAAGRPASASPEGQVTVGVHVTLTPRWFDPADTEGIVTPYLFLYALHDAMVKAMPDGNLTPSLAKSWSMTDDGLTYEFVMRDGVRFHNGDPVTAEDVKFSFTRYRGTAQADMKQRVASIDIPAPGIVRFRLKEPWPDFLTYYSNATGAGWVVPKAYIEKIGEDGFRKAPVGAGPYKFVSFVPGVELVLEANEQFWRKIPSIKRIVLTGIPDESTRLAALRRGEIDIAYQITGELARSLRQTPGFSIDAAVASTPFWLYFPDQWDPKSPWHDVRVRRAVASAIDYDGLNQAISLGFSHITGSLFPENFEFFKPMPKPVHDTAKAKQLLAEAGYPDGFDAGFFNCDSSFSSIGEIVLDGLVAAGIRAKLRPLERAAFFKSYADKKFKDVVMGASGAMGNVPIRLQQFVVKGGTYAYGNYPEIDALFPLQATESDPVKRTAILHQMQDLLHERAVYAPIWQIAATVGIGPRVGVSGLGRIKGYPWTGPYEDMTLKGK